MIAVWQAAAGRAGRCQQPRWCCCHADQARSVSIWLRVARTCGPPPTACAIHSVSALLELILRPLSDRQLQRSRAPTQRCHSADTVPSQSRHSPATVPLQPSHSRVTDLPQSCHSPVTDPSQSSHSPVTVLPQPCHSPASDLPQSCHSPGSALHQPCTSPAPVPPIPNLSVMGRSRMVAGSVE